MVPPTPPTAPKAGAPNAASRVLSSAPRTRGARPLASAFACVLGQGKLAMPVHAPLPAAHPIAVPGAGHVAHGHGHAKAAPEKDPEKPHGAPDLLDPETRRCLQMGPPALTPATAPAPVAVDAAIVPRARVSMEELLPQLVKRIAWAGDKRRGSVQMELGAGPHAGTVITVHADDGRVRVELAGDDAGALRRRLEAKGFEVER